MTSTANTETRNSASDTHIRAPWYQWLLFDADGTLFDYDRAESAALGQAFRQIGVPFDPGYLTAYRRINQTLWQAVERGEITPGIVKVRRFELLVDGLKIARAPAELSTRYLECLATCSELMENADEVLGALRRKYRIAIVTNGLRDVQRGRLARSTIRHHISEVIISEEIGFAKPAKEFFDATFARLGNPPKAEVLMVGDGWASDIQGAVQYGLDACWYNPGNKARPAAPEITREIASLRQLIDWLL
jgi:YjjG family noncanonical pyrimidine nucleotidase